MIIVDITGGLYRVSGIARDLTTTTEWSLVVKVVRDPRLTTPQTDAFNWKRELLAYQSGLLASLPGQLLAPQCYGVTKRPDGDAYLWIEEMVEHGPRCWPLETYAIAARDLGSFSRAYLWTAADGGGDCGWVTLTEFALERADEARILAARAGTLERHLGGRQAMTLAQNIAYVLVDNAEHTYCRYAGGRSALPVTSDRSSPLRTIVPEPRGSGPL